MNIKQFLKFKMHTFKHLIQKKHLFRRMNKNVSMRRMIDNQAIKTQILEIMHEKLDHKKKEFIRKSRQNISDSKSCEMSRIIWRSVIFVSEKLFRKRKKSYISFELTFCDKKYASILFICNHLKKNIIWYSLERISRNELKTEL